jgi:hypothetical protein
VRATNGAHGASEQRDKLAPSQLTKLHALPPAGAQHSDCRGVSQGALHCEMSSRLWTGLRHSRLGRDQQQLPPCRLCLRKRTRFAHNEFFAFRSTAVTPFSLSEQASLLTAGIGCLGVWCDTTIQSRFACLSYRGSVCLPLSSVRVPRTSRQKNLILLDAIIMGPFPAVPSINSDTSRTSIFPKANQKPAN